MAKTKEPKAKQGHLNGLEPPSIPEIDAASEEYVDLRDKRMKLLEKEIEANNAVLALMKEHGLATYQYDGDGVTHIISVTHLEKVKVKRAKDDEEYEE